MKRFAELWSVVWLTIVMVTLCFGCNTGSTIVRDESLMPAAVMAWEGVRLDVERGIQDAVLDGELADASGLQEVVAKMDTALKSKSREALRLVPWPVLSPYALRGINARVEAGEMVEQAAVFLRRRLDNFNQAIQALTDPAYAYVSPIVPYRTRSRRVTVPTYLGDVPLVAVVAH